MKQIFIVAADAVKTAWQKFNCAILAFLCMSVTIPALALTKTDLTKDAAGGKGFDEVAGNLDEASQTMATLLIQFVSVGGFVVVGVSLYQLYKASKDEREKPVSAVVGLFIGGAMAAVGTIMWIMKNTVTAGTGNPVTGT